MRLLQLTLLLLLGVLQYRLWFADNGVMDRRRLENEIAEQQQLIVDQQLKNETLKARVDDLKSGNDAVEELARQNLGLIKPGETFVIIVDEP
ncbi:MAG: cell division protein FtsB [Reinekea sp.]|jgi:cell division protein FtsB